MEGTRMKTTKSLRSGKKIAEFDVSTEEPEKKKRAWESWSFEDK